MCGRYVLILDDGFAARFSVAAPGAEVASSYNIAPGRDVPVVARAGEGNALALIRWGLRPPWLKGPDSARGIINVRAETALGKPTFNAVLRHGRCLVPATGFYEWRADEDGQKQPFFFRAASPYVAFAGVRDGDGVAILTTGANGAVAKVHDRMPVILDLEGERRWLDPAIDEPTVASLLQPAPEDLLTATAVARTVNDASRDEPGLIRPQAAA